MPMSPLDAALEGFARLSYTLNNDLSALVTFLEHQNQPLFAQKVQAIQTDLFNVLKEISALVVLVASEGR